MGRVTSCGAVIFICPASHLPLLLDYLYHYYYTTYRHHATHPRPTPRPPAPDHSLRLHHRRRRRWYSSSCLRLDSANETGIGLSAKAAEKGGADLILVYNSGRFRMAGRGSLAGLMPYSDANQVVVEMVSPRLTLLYMFISALYVLTQAGQ